MHRPPLHVFGPWQTEAGVALLRSVLEPLTREQLTLVLTPTLRAYAEGLARLGDVEEAEKIIVDLVEHAETASPTFLLPELLRTQADILLAARPDDTAGAEACYRKALARAQSDGALGWEMRAANALARLLIRAERFDAAREALAPVFSRFTEEFDSGDLLEARQLLRSLDANVPVPRRAARARAR